MLVVMVGDGAHAFDRLDVAGAQLPLRVTALDRLALLDALQAFRRVPLRRVGARPEVSPRAGDAMFVVNRHHPAGKSAAPEVSRRAPVDRKRGPRLREIRQDEFVDPHPDIAADAPRGGAEEAGFVPLIKTNFAQRAEALGELSVVQKRGMRRVGDGVQHLQPVAIEPHFVRRHHRVRQLKSVINREARARLRRPQISEN